MRIAITGTIGSGKTMACEYIKSKGYSVFDCDAENRQLLETRAYELLFNDFENCFDGKELNKQKLSQLVFENEDERLKLEAIMHPLILEKMLKSEDDVIFAEVPLLFEVGWDKYFDLAVLIVCDENIALQRLENRGLALAEAKKRINNQMSIEEKIKKANIIIYNNGGLDDLYHAIDKFVLDILC